MHSIAVDVEVGEDREDSAVILVLGRQAKLCHQAADVGLDGPIAQPQTTRDPGSVWTFAARGVDLGRSSPRNEQLIAVPVSLDALCR